MNQAIKIGKRIKAARIDCEISKIELAEGVDVTLSLVYKWEYGERTPPIVRLVKIIKFFRKFGKKYDAEYFLGL